MRHKDFIARLDQQRVVDAISFAELQTSGEIRVHIQPKVGAGEPRTYAEGVFESLGMAKTAERNGVLLFIASEDQNFVILGDAGIDAKVPPGFWNEIAAKLTLRFRSGDFTEGIVEAVTAAGEHLKKYFPRAENDVNELSNEINISNE